MSLINLKQIDNDYKKSLYFSLNKTEEQEVMLESSRNFCDAYEVIESDFDEGGQATVMKAQCRTTGKFVAVKTFFDSSDDAVIKRALEEG